MPDSTLKSTTETTPPLDYAPVRPGLAERLGDWLPSGEQVSNFLKTLVWVAPLTLLIWVYAEREETVKVTLPAFPLVVKTTVPDRVVDLRYPQDHNVVVELSGPRARIDAVREKLAGKPLELLIDPQLRPGGKELMSAPLLNNHPLFRSNGITVKACLPVSFSVSIDQIEERPAVVKATRASAAMVEYASFQPDRVKIRAPSKLFADAPIDEETKELYVDANFAGRSEIRTRTGKVELDNVPISWGDRRENVSLSSQSVRAVLTLKQADAQFTIPSVTIFKQMPNSLDDNLRVKYEASIPNVTVTGAPDLIEMIRKNPKIVTARLIVKETAHDEPTNGDLVFDLPAGVKLAKGTPDKWPYTLVDR